MRTVSESEVVVPVFSAGGHTLVGVLDIDSRVKARFTQQLQETLEEVCVQLQTACDWEPLLREMTDSSS